MLYTQKWNFGGNVYPLNRNTEVLVIYYNNLDLDVNKSSFTKLVQQWDNADDN